MDKLKTLKMNDKKFELIHKAMKCPECKVGLVNYMPIIRLGVLKRSRPSGAYCSKCDAVWREIK